MKKKFALFDVDKTLIAGDSMFDLLFWTWKKHPVSLIPSCLNIIKGIIKYLFTGFKDIRPMKNGIFYVVKYLNSEETAEFTEKVLFNKRFYKDAFVELEKKRDEDFYILLVSASPEFYLKYFYKLIPNNGIIGTIIDENGIIQGNNCKSNEKVKRISSWLEDNSLEIDYENSCGYSDSLSADGPMLSLVKDKYLINSDKKVPGYTNLNWS